MREAILLFFHFPTKITWLGKVERIRGQGPRDDLLEEEGGGDGGGWCYFFFFTLAFFLSPVANELARSSQFNGIRPVS